MSRRPVPFEDFPPAPGPVSTRTVRGAAKWLKVLADKGITPPIDASHAQMFDPPLTITEQRHGLHVRHGSPAPSCRFCEEAASETTEEGSEARPDGAV